MKQLACILTWMIFALLTRAQTIELCTDKTTSLVLPYPIKHVDRGIKEVLVKPVEGADKVLLLKAATRDFPPTNVTIITEGGHVFSFAIVYDHSPNKLTYEVHPPSPTPYNVSMRLLDNPPTLRHPYDRSWDIDIRLTGIYIKGDMLYYQLTLHNSGPLDYDVEGIRWYIKDKRKTKRAATQEWEQLPLAVAGNPNVVRARSESKLVFAMERCTLPKHKGIMLEVMEKNGGRHLQLHLTNNHLIKATILPD